MRRIARAGILVLGWALFGLLWSRALAQVSARAVVLTVAILAFAVVVNAIGAVLLLRGRHDRLPATRARARSGSDRLGRSLLVDVDARTAQVVAVMVDPHTGQKRLRAGGGIDA